MLNIISSGKIVTILHALISGKVELCQFAELLDESQKCGARGDGPASSKSSKALSSGYKHSMLLTVAKRDSVIILNIVLVLYLEISPNSIASLSQKVFVWGKAFCSNALRKLWIVRNREFVSTIIGYRSSEGPSLRVGRQQEACLKSSIMCSTKTQLSSLDSVYLPAMLVPLSLNVHPTEGRAC